MKKICSVLLSAVIAICPFQTITIYSATETSQIIVGTENAVAGESVVIPVSLNNNAGIIGADFSIVYDTEKLKLVEVVNEKLLSDATFSTSETESIPYRVFFDDARTENYTEDGILVSLHFEVLEAADEGFTPVEVTIKEDSFVDADIEYVTFEAVSGGVNISTKTETTTETATTQTTTSETTAITTTTTLIANLSQIIVGTENAVAGESVVISVSLNNNTGIIGADFSINYDISKLKLVEVVNEKLLSDATFSTSEAGSIPYRVFFDDARTENYTEDGVLVSLRFEVLEDAESGFTPVEVIIKEDSFVDADVEYVNFETVSGGVKISESTITTTEPITTTITSTTTTTKLTTTTSTTTTSNTTTTESTTTTSTTTELTTTTTTPVTNYSLGDVNGDGYLDAKDASMILKSYAYISAGGSISDIEKMSADVNKDGLIDADDASIILSTYASFGAGVFSEYQELFDILPNMNASSDGGYTSEEIENSSIKPFVSVEKLVVSLDEAKNNPVLKVSVNLSELGDNEFFWCSGGITLKYDSRLKPVLNNVGEADVSVGEAIEYQNYIVEMNEETNCLFIAVAGSSDYASMGNIITIPFTLPNDVDYGEQYNIEIVHSGCEIFANSDDDETSRLMQVYLFTRGIDNGYIKIDDYVPTTTTESITTSTTTTITTEFTTTSTTTTTESTTTNTTTMNTITTTEPPITTTVVPAKYKLGDVNEDNMVDAVDASLILQEYALLSTGGSGNFTDIQKSVADINDDGMTDAVDASLVLQYYAYVSTGGEKSSEEFFNKNIES